MLVREPFFTGFGTSTYQYLSEVGLVEDEAIAATAFSCLKNRKSCENGPGIYRRNPARRGG